MISIWEFWKMNSSSLHSCWYHLTTTISENSTLIFFLVSKLRQNGLGFLEQMATLGRYSDSDMAFKATIFFFNREIQNRVVVSLGPGGDFEASKSGWGWQWGLRGWNPSCRCEIDSEDDLPSGELTQQWNIPIFNALSSDNDLAEKYIKMGNTSSKGVHLPLQC